MKLESRLGETIINKQGLKMTIMNYVDCHNIDVIFEDKTICKNREYKNFVIGRIFNRNYPHIYGLGYIGDGEYNTNDIGYRYWYRIFERCYNDKQLIKRPSYLGCSICEEWYNFQNFAKWFCKNYYKIDNATMQIDKDILIKNNKIYSPNTCLIVPQRINTLFVNRKSDRGNLPIGVRKDSNKFLSTCNIGGYNQKYLGEYNTPEEAFYSYKQFKELYIKQVADEYKNMIPQKLYNAMYNYVIDITD